MLQTPEHVNAWTNAWYVLNYNDGIGSRLLAGTLLKLFAGNYVTQKETLTYIYIVLLILFGLVSALIGKVIRKSDQDKEAVLLFVAIYLACPGSVVYYATNAGLLEMFSLTFFLSGIIMFENLRNEYVRYIIVFLFSVFALSAHQGTIFYYYPVIVTILMYELCTKFSFKKLVFTFANYMGVFLIFIYFQLFSRLYYDTLETTVKILRDRTDMQIDENAVRLEYFASLKENFEYGQAYFLKNYNYEKMVFLSMVILMPLLLLLQEY